MKQPCVYLMASQRNGTLYIGVTSNLIQRVWQHREGIVEGFTKEYGVKILVWFEQHETMECAIVREKQLKKWNREWKLRLIEKANPQWLDLWPEIIGEGALDSSSPRSFVGDPELKALDSRLRGNDDELHLPSSPKSFIGDPELKALDSRLRGNDGSETVGDSL